MSKPYNFSLTFKFIDIFPDYETFKEFTDEIDVTKKNVGFPLNEELYYYLCYRYYNRDVNYTSKEGFKYAFALEYKNQYKKFGQKFSLIHQMYDLELDDLVNNGLVISNFSGNDKSDIENPLKPLNYIINQSVNYSEKPKLLAYVDAINNLMDEGIDEFLDKFKYLFSMFIKDFEAIY